MASPLKIFPKECNKFFTINTSSFKNKNLPILNTSRNDSLNQSKTSRTNDKLCMYKNKTNNISNYTQKEKEKNLKIYLNTFSNSLFSNSLPYPSVFHKNKIIDLNQKKRTKLKIKDKRNSLNKIFFNLNNFPYQDNDNPKNIKTFFINSNKPKSIEENKKTVSMINLIKNDDNKRINLLGNIPIEVINDLAQKIYLDNLNKVKNQKILQKPKNLCISNTFFKYILDNINRLIETKNQKNQFISFDYVKNLLNNEIQELNNAIQGKSSKSNIEVVNKKLGCDSCSTFGSNIIGKNNSEGSYGSDKKEKNSSDLKENNTNMNGLIKNLYNSKSKGKKIFFETQNEKKLYNNINNIKDRNLFGNQDLKFCSTTPNKFKVNTVFSENKNNNTNHNKNEIKNNKNKEYYESLKFLYEKNTNEKAKPDFLKKKLNTKLISKETKNNNIDKKQHNYINISLNNSSNSDSNDNNNENHINKNNKKHNENNSKKCSDNIKDTFMRKKIDFISVKHHSSKHMNRLKLKPRIIPQRRKSFSKHLAFNNPIHKYYFQNDLSKNSKNKIINIKNKEKNKNEENNLAEKTNAFNSKNNLKKLATKMSVDEIALNDLKKLVNANNKINLKVKIRNDSKPQLTFPKKRETTNMKQLKKMIRNNKLKEKEKIIKQINCMKKLDESSKLNIFKYILNYIYDIEKNFGTEDKEKEKEMEAQKNKLIIIIKDYFAKLIRTAIQEKKQKEQPYFELYQRLDFLRKYDLFNQEDLAELEKKVLDEEANKFQIESIRRRFYIIKGKVVCDDVLPNDKQLIFDNSYLIKNKPKVEFEIKKEVLDILNDEPPKTQNKNEGYKYPLYKTKLLKKHIISSEKIISNNNINESGIDLDNLNEKDDLCDVKNYLTPSEEEERQQNLRDKKLYSFFAKIQKLKNSKNLLNDDIDDILSDQIDSELLNDQKLENRINNFLKELRLNRVKYKYDTSYKLKSINYISPIRFKQANNNSIETKQ